MEMNSIVVFVTTMEIQRLDLQETEATLILLQYLLRQEDQGDLKGPGMIEQR